MAQDPKQYRSRGITLESQQPLQFTQFQEAVRGSQTLSARIDKISNMAFEKMAVEAEKRGKMFGVQNRPTLEQISIAIEKDQDVNELFAEEGTIAGDAARATQAQLLKQDLLNDLTARFQEIDKGIEAGMLSKDEVIIEMNAAIEGYGRILGQIDPDQELKFRSSAATVGFQSVAKANKFEIKAAKIKHANQVSDFMTYADDYIKTVLDNDNNPASITVTLMEREVAAQQLFSLDQDTYFENMENYKKVQKNAVMDHIANQVVDSGTLIDFRKGNVGEMLPLLVSQGMNTDEDIKAIFDKALTIEDDVNKVLDTEKKQKILVNEEAMMDKYIELTRGDITEDEYIATAKNVGYPLTPTIVNQIRTNARPTIQQTEDYGVYESQIMLGQLTRRQVNELVADGSLNWKQGEELKKLHKEITGKHSDAFNIIAGRFNISNFSLIDLNANQTIRSVINRAKSRYIQEANFAQATGEAFYPSERARQIANEEYNNYTDEKVTEHETKVIDIFSDLQGAYDRNQFMSMSKSDIANLKTTDGNNIATTAANVLLSKQRMMKKVINKALDID